MRMDEAFYNLFMYLYNKNVLEYAQISQSGPKSMFPNIEGHSIIKLDYVRLRICYQTNILIHS